MEFINSTLIDPATIIICRNIRRRHHTTQQQTDLIVADNKAAEGQAQRVSRQVGGKPGRPANKVKAKVVADAKKLGISERTAKRSWATAEGKKPSKPRRRRTAA